MCTVGQEFNRKLPTADSRACDQTNWFFLTLNCLIGLTGGWKFKSNPVSFLVWELSGYPRFSVSFPKNTPRVQTCNYKQVTGQKVREGRMCWATFTMADALVGWSPGCAEPLLGTRRGHTEETCCSLDMRSTVLLQWLWANHKGPCNTVLPRSNR